MIDEFHNILASKYEIKRLGKPTEFSRWAITYQPEGTIGLSQPTLTQATIDNEGMLG